MILLKNMDIRYRKLRTAMEMIVKDLRLHNESINVSVEVCNLHNIRLHGRVLHRPETNIWRIWINDNTDDSYSQIDTLAHEFRHIWQDVNNVYWKEYINYKNGELNSKEYQDYYMQPCEIDARWYSEKFTKKYKG